MLPFKNSIELDLNNIKSNKMGIKSRPRTNSEDIIVSDRALNQFNVKEPKK